MNDMTNSHILVHEFTYMEPVSVAEAISLLATHGNAARVLAGGTDLLVQMKMERQEPAYVIGIGKLAELKGIRPGIDKLTIGALTTIRALARDAGVHNRYTALAEACAAFSTAQVQAMGTVGGNLCNGSPASDTAPALIALGAEVVLVGPEGETRLPLERFFRGQGKTARRSDQLLTAVEISFPVAQAGSAFVKIGRVSADIAKANAAVYLVRDGDRIADCRLAFGSVAPTPMRAPRAEAILRGQMLTAELISQVAAVAVEEISPIDDVRSTAAYRRQVVAALTMDGINRAWERAARGTGEQGSGGDTETRRHGDTETRDSGGPAHTQYATRSAQPVLPHYLTTALSHYRSISLTVNGVPRRLHVADNDLLLNVLREDLELTGTKYGCGIGECSACTVLQDGKPVLACLVLAAAADGSHIRTVEGLAAPDGTLDPLQEAFIEHAALQCGFCTPGMLMTAKDLLETTPHPTEADVRDHLRGNMCRCTGYAAIVRAVLAAADGQIADGK
jgi:xanthine dehydrogenase iron-sulfur cluster and FAD-binding subunit A